MSALSASANCNFRGNVDAGVRKASSLVVLLVYIPAAALIEDDMTTINGISISDTSCNIGKGEELTEGEQTVV